MNLITPSCSCISLCYSMSLFYLPALLVEKCVVLPDRQRVMHLDTNTLIHTIVPNNINNSSWGKWLNIYQVSFWQSKFTEALFACSIQYNRPDETFESNSNLKLLPNVWHCTQAWLRQTSWFSVRYTSNYWSVINDFSFLVRVF